MEIRRNPRLEDNEKYLVAEQPGMFITFLGLILAALLGFTLRGLLNPVRIEEQLKQAASQVHRQIKIEFTSARASLHSHGWPRLAVIVENVIVNADQPCWMSPKLKIDQMELPVSLWNLMMGSGPIDEVRLGKVQLWLGDYNSSCQDTAAISSLPQATTPSTLPRIKIKDESSKIPDNPTDVRKLTINEISIYQDVHFKNGLYLKNIEMFANSSQPLNLDVQGLIPIEKYFVSEEIFGAVNFDVQYTEFPEKLLSWRLEGPLREGRLQSTGKVSLTNKNYEIDANLDHIPWVQFLQKDGKEQLKLLPRQSWMTVKVHAKDTFADKKNYPVEIQRFRIDGPSATLETKPFLLMLGEKTTWEPIEINVNNFELLPFIKILGVKEVPNILGDLGKFRGTARVNSENEFKIDGTLADLEFIFSNLGRREKQLVNFKHFEILRRGNSFETKLEGLGTDLSPEAGDLKVTLDIESQNVEAQANFTGLRFSRNITDLFQAQMGEKGVFGSLKSNWQSGSFKFLKWDLNLPSIHFPNIEIESTRAQGFKNEVAISTHFSFPQIQFNEGLLKKFNSQELANTNGNLALTNASLSMKGASLNQISWIANGEGIKDRIRVNGQWDEQGELQGDVQVRGGRNIKGFIGGQREKPLVKWSTP